MAFKETVCNEEVPPLGGVTGRAAAKCCQSEPLEQQGRKGSVLKLQRSGEKSLLRRWKGRLARKLLRADSLWTRAQFPDKLRHGVTVLPHHTSYERTYPNHMASRFPILAFSESRSCVSCCPHLLHSTPLCNLIPT
eukprot:1294737-Rhodomonas_salina.9